ncbi:MAG: FAD:protein FMN transferase [Ideonella sp.]|nr:FAD:protein FMN transferase [Ideonella sp.]
MFAVPRPFQRRADAAAVRAAAAPCGDWLRAEAAIMGDRAMSPHRPDSELSRLNAHAARGPVEVSGEMFALLARAVAFSRLSGGAFDITYASVGHLFDYRAGMRPDDATLARARQAIGWRHLELDARSRTVRYTHAGTRIDLGGFAKGYAVDNATSLLRGLGIHHAIVSAGGDSRVIGDRRGQPWTVAIRHPRLADEVVAVLPLADCAISTSGDYERFFDEGDVRWHHIVDPATGRSPDRLHSVTILADDGLTAEALSKTVFVLGVERGLPLVESVPGADAVVVDAHGGLHATNGFGPAGSLAPASGSGIAATRQ